MAGVGTLSSVASAQPAPPADPPPADEPPPPSDDKQPDKPTFKAPNAPPGVPDPGPTVLGGRATAADTVGRPLHYTRTPFGTTDYVVTAAAGALTLGAAIVSPWPKHALQGPVLFDSSVRNLLRPRDIQTRYAFRDASDVMLSISATFPFFVDALATAWWYRGSRETAQQMALLSLETMAISGAVQGVTNVFVSRERPYGENCGTPDLPSNSIDCDSNSHHRSFFSGHTAFTFTSAALICVNHFDNDLLPGPWDAIACAGGYALAATTGTFRVVGDVHYASDVLTGALVGSLVGYGVPLLHKRHPDFNQVKTDAMTIRIVPTGMGAGVVGVF